MKKTDARIENNIAVLKSIARRNNTIAEIHNDTDIGYQTIWEITNELIAKKYLKRSPTGKRDMVGRRPGFFDISPNFYSTFVIEHPRIYSIISINIEGRVRYRFDYYKRRDLSKRDDVKKLIGRIRRAPSYGKNCVNVFLTCSDETAKYLPKDYIRTSMEDLILNGLATDRTIALFKINDMLAVSLFSKIIKFDSSITEDDIKKILPIDEYYEYDGELYFGVFDALENNTVKNFYKLI